MKILNAPVVDEKPKNCLECRFNENKYCSLKTAMDIETTFVQNNRDNVCEDCPLILDHLWKHKRIIEKLLYLIENKDVDSITSKIWILKAKVLLGLVEDNTTKDGE
jgi:hypothetical protein